ncbi:hypothetical protein [Pedobacter psychroterrae]|uniref:hypothetical protein n=1 Tax=Pedobacter psychroterrae TaxID=2530453 RepID=UPI0019821925|nr:hypothetical protein [Pedobacter psychroterrae]
MNQKPVLSDTTNTRASMPVDQIFSHATSDEPTADYYYFTLPVSTEGTANISAYFSTVSFYDRQPRKYDRYSGKLLVAGERSSSLSASDQLNRSTTTYIPAPRWVYLGKY